MKQHTKGMIAQVAFAATCLLNFPAISVAQDEALADALAEHMEFSEYSAGILVPEQVPPNELGQYFLIDARDSGQFSEGHLPGAMNIEWREVVSKLDLIPNDKPILVYCNTGTLSSRAAFALRLLGYNALVLQEGRNGWLARYSK